VDPRPPPKSGVHLTHCTDAVLHCLSFDGLVAGGQETILIPFTKDLEHGDRIFPGRQVGVDIVGHAESFPARPMIFHGFGALFCNSSLDAFTYKAEISAQSIGLRTW
jgi:hypothetical protein